MIKAYLRNYIIPIIIFNVLPFFSRSQIAFDTCVRGIPTRFFEVGEKLNKFISKGEFHIATFILNNDSSFIYYNISLESNDLTIGKYFVKDNLFFFKWDSIKTYDAVSDSSFCKKYFRASNPSPLKITEKKFELKSDHSLNQEPLIELFFSSNDLFSHGKYIDSLRFSDWFRTIHYNLKENKMIIYRYKPKQTIFPYDSIWGYRFLSNEYIPYVIRLRGGDLNLRVEQYDEMVIYSIVYNSGRSGHTDYYFSTTLDSDVLPLNKTKIKERYKNNKYFLGLIEKEIKWYQSVSDHDSKTNTFKIIKLYKQSLKQNPPKTNN